MLKIIFRTYITDAAPINRNCRTSNISKGYHQTENHPHPCNELTTIAFCQTRQVFAGAAVLDIPGNGDRSANKNRERPERGRSRFL